MSAIRPGDHGVRRRTARAGAVTFTLLLAFSGTAAAQGGTIIGTVTDRGTGQPIEAARAQIVGSTVGSATDSRGRFVLRPGGLGQYQVRVARIGFRPEVSIVTVNASDTARVSFVLSQSAVELDQVVVTGTGGAVEKRKLGSSMGVVDMTQVQDQLPGADFGVALAAKIPGVRSVGVGGGAGAARDIRIRGFASFTLDQRPVIYIDGVRVDRRATEWTGAIGARSMACCAF